MAIFRRGSSRSMRTGIILLCITASAALLGVGVRYLPEFLSGRTESSPSDGIRVSGADRRASDWEAENLELHALNRAAQLQQGSLRKDERESVIQFLAQFIQSRDGPISDAERTALGALLDSLKDDRMERYTTVVYLPLCFSRHPSVVQDLEAYLNDADERFALRVYMVLNENGHRTDDAAASRLLEAMISPNKDVRMDARAYFQYELRFTEVPGLRTRMKNLREEAPQYAAEIDAGISLLPPGHS